MSYEFALEKKAVISVVASWFLIGALLFLAGWIVGRQWPISEAASTRSAAAEEQHAELPKEPVLDDEVPARNSSAPKTVNPKITPPAEANAKPPAQAKASLPESVEPAAAPAAPSDGRVVIISEAETDEANKPQVEPEYVTVQVGVFLDEKEASRLLHQMERKGYAPSFFSGRDAEARQWYAVRIGSYSDREQATKAAANFTRQEGMKAVVRPLESL